MQINSIIIREVADGSLSSIKYFDGCRNPTLGYATSTLDRFVELSSKSTVEFNQTWSNRLKITDYLS